MKDVNMDSIALMVSQYQEKFDHFGYSPKSLGWDKGRQDVRFKILTTFFDLRGKSILDVGCGFGDLYRFLVRNYGVDFTYTGIDLVPEFLDIARIQCPEKNANFLKGNFIDFQFKENFDIVLGSGIFNHRFEDGLNTRFFEEIAKKAFGVSRDGFAFDFLSDKVEYTLPHAFHNNPEDILTYLYQYSRNIILRNDFIPFEFAIALFKDNSYNKDEVIFERWKGLQSSSGLK